MFTMKEKIIMSLLMVEGTLCLIFEMKFRRGLYKALDKRGLIKEDGTVDISRVAEIEGERKEF